MLSFDRSASQLQHHTTKYLQKQSHNAIERSSRLDLFTDLSVDTLGDLPRSYLRTNEISFERHRMPNDVVEELPTHTVAQTHPVETTRSTRASSTVSSRSVRPPTSPSTESKTPLTPEESPPYHRSTRKRASTNLEDDESSYRSVEPSPTHSRHNSGEQASVQVCICQPDPKIPRPRNAFILYRQHHQSKVIAEHPGLANPEISKIIGEQWRAENQATKEVWKSLANDEKARHQQQYPTYRYQPRRNTRRGSVTDTPGSAVSDKARCIKCGGRISAYPTPSQTTTASPSSSALPVPAQLPVSTPVSRTLPVLGDLNLQSPIPPQMMTARHHDERDDPGLMSPNSKRRRYNNEQPVYMYRAMPPRYTVAPAPNQAAPYGYAPPQHPYPAAQSPSHVRRESLPGLHIMSPSGAMAPPPRPGMGYQQHRLSQGHIAPDRSLTLPPLQTSQAPPTPHKPSPSKSVRETIMEIPLSDKLGVLRRIAPPTRISRTTPRGPLIAVEGDSLSAVTSLARWLVDTMSRDEELSVRLVDPPDVTSDGDEETAMSDYHILAADWLKRSKSLAQELSYTLPTPPPSAKSAMSVDNSTRTSRAGSKADIKEGDEMNVDEPENKTTSGQETSAANDETQPRLVSRKPVLVVPAYSLYATNIFSCRMPITDVYSPWDHWQWSATLWRGIIGPDLTVYVKDKDFDESRKSFDFSERERLCLVKRSSVEGSDDLEIDDATLRRVGFEVNEWIRAHGVQKRTS